MDGFNRAKPKMKSTKNRKVAQPDLKTITKLPPAMGNLNFMAI
jgi:hypothetical protein